MLDRESWLTFLSGFKPALGRVEPREHLRATVGAVIGIFLTYFLTVLALGPEGASPLIIAPMGASAVLLFAVPASPLAQPWSAFGGNVVSGLVGVTIALAVPNPIAAAALAVSLAIGTMIACRCLHPPGGAVALTCVVGGPAVHAAGYWFVLSPLAVNTAIIVAAAIAYNNLTGRRYPNVAAPAAAKSTDPPPSERLGLTTADLDAALKKSGAIFDITRADLAELVRQAEAEAYHRRYGAATAGEIMSQDYEAAHVGMPLREAWNALRKGRIKALPVINADRKPIGLVTVTDFMNFSDWGGDDRPTVGAMRRLKQIARREKANLGAVGQIMSWPVSLTSRDTKISDLVPAIADQGVQYICVVDELGRLVGVITEADMVGALFSGSVAGLVERGAPPAAGAVHSGATD